MDNIIKTYDDRSDLPPLDSAVTPPLTEPPGQPPGDTFGPIVELR